MSNFLGLAVGDRSLLAAEVSVSRERSALRRVAEFVFPPGKTLEQPDDLGEALAQFLRQNKFSASKVVVGVPARWLIAREKEVPPSRVDAAIGMLKLASERLVSADLEMVFDFAGQPDPAAQSKVLLVGLLKQQADRLTKMVDAAGLSLLGITSTTLTLANAAGEEAGGVVVSLGSDAIEVAAHSKGTPVLLRHVGAAGGGAAAVSLIGPELRRAVSGAQIGGLNGASRSMLLWDGIGLGADETTTLGERSGLQADIGKDLDRLGVHANGEFGGNDMRRFGPAAALALAAGDRGLLAVDFLHSRLAVRKQRRVGRKGAWGIFIGTVIILAIGVLVWDVQRKQSQLDELNQVLEHNAPDVVAAKAVQAKVQLAHPWFDARPKVLDCLKDVTESLGVREPIWITNCSIKDDHSVVLSGRAANKDIAILVQKRMAANKKFADVRLQDLRETGGRSQDYTFAIKFLYLAN